MEKITLKATADRNIFSAESAKGAMASLELFTAPDGATCLRSVGGNPSRVFVVSDPLFWLAFRDGAEIVEIEFERRIIKK